MSINFLKKGTLSFFLISLLSSTVYAESSYGYGKNKGNSGKDDQGNIYYPLENNPQTAAFPPRWKEDRFILNINEDVAQDVAKKGTRYKKIMTQTYDLDMLMKPITKPFKGIDKIYVTSEYTTSIMFPMKYAVVAVNSSIPLTLNAHSSNSLTIQPTRNFVEGNLVVSLSSGSENKLVNILMERYVPGMTSKNEDFDSKYASEKQFVSTMIVYRDLPKVDDVEILETLFKLYGNKVGGVFSEDCKFETLTYDGIQFFVIRDDKYGKIEYDGINYRIDNEYTGCGENASMNVYSTNDTLK